MLPVLNFIFSTPFTFFGTLILVVFGFDGLADVVRAFRRPGPGNE